MLAEDPTLRAGVLFSPLSDARNAVENMDQNPMQMLGFAGWLGARLRSYVSRDPRPRDEAWSARSPVLVASTLRMPIVIVHGTSDPLIPLAQTCRLRDTLWKSGRPVRERLLTHAGLPAPAAEAQAIAQANLAGGGEADLALDGDGQDLFLIGGGDAMLTSQDLRELAKRVVDELGISWPSDGDE